MRGLWSLLVIALIFGMVYSAALLYRAKGETRAAVRASDRLETRAEELRGQIAELDMEWAYLNGPENLNRLLVLYSDELGLKERHPNSFARLSELPIRGAGIGAMQELNDNGVSE